MTVPQADGRLHLGVALDGAGWRLIPTVTATHTEPLHISKAIATLDCIRSGEGAIEFPTPHQARSHSWTGEDRPMVADQVRSSELLAEEWNRQ